MKTGKFDNNSFSPYRGNADVEVVVKQSQLKYLYMKIDKALSDGTWEDDPKSFRELVDKYNEERIALETLNNLLTAD